jgi:HD superfamily phosphohydrolase
MLIDIRNSIIRDNIEGNRLIEASLDIRKVIDAPEFQRLRSIKQMGLSSFVFPTAEHSRFAHSLGVYATAKQVFSQLRLRASPLPLSGPWFRFDETAEADFCTAALCHDIGHTAFSHVLENVLLPDGFRSHEDCTRALISGNTHISRFIEDVADREAVILYFDKKHPNKALNDLISSPFDVDRCDYVLRDGIMSGVEYGKYDLRWLIHALRVVKAQYLGHPVLLLEGPRGIDALRQFLSARRYLYRQVYFHASVRAAQILLKGIFERMQDFGETLNAVDITPDCLRPILAGKKPSLGQFIDTTDNEILFMIRSYAKSHKDETLRYLCNLFICRQFPKCVLDSSKRNTPISSQYNIKFSSDGPVEQPSFWEETDPKEIATVSREIQAFVSNKMGAIGAPTDAARYLVSMDRVEFRSDPPADLLFAFQDETVPLENVDEGSVGFDVKGLLENFSIDRLFVPAGLEDDVKEFMTDHFSRPNREIPLS